MQVRTYVRLVLLLYYYMLYSTEMGESERYKWKEDRCTEGPLANGHNTIKCYKLE